MSGTFGKGHHLHLIDGSAFIFRAYHALPPLTRKSDGLPIGAVAGFCNMLHRYVEGNTGPDAPTHVAVIFDKGSHTFRNDMYDKYKANREAMPEDLRPQIPLTRTATEAFNIACKEKEGFEADDIIATLAVQARAAGGRCTIISSDKDLMQLVGGGVEMLDAMKNKSIDRDGVFEKFGVYPDRVVDVQALAGDSVDNVPGAPGIGIKTAALLINEYGDLDALLERASEIKQPKRRQTLIDHAEQIRLSRSLVLLDENTPIDFTIDDLEVRDPDADRLLGFLSEMEFRTLSKRVAEVLGREAPAIPDAPAPALADAPQVADVPFDHSKYEQVSDAEALRVWLDRIYEVGYVAVDTETTGLNEMTAELVGVSLAVEAGQACYIPLTHKASRSDDLFGSDDLAPGQMPIEEALQLLTPMLEDPAILKIGQNMKYDGKIFAQLGITVAPIDDTMLMSYAMHAGLHGHGMDTLSERYLGHTPLPIKPL
ncbi:5'-3' exonuclease H3TH domain-containing protein, partial [uncultured Sulfitobacter sp.]|uniref:5'-3' exonuclease H3TH domain-containing protein n=1 Tax=uncultured Sulfitobacter sp. TaxID=191468 RepID=UPI002599CD33